MVFNQFKDKHNIDKYLELGLVLLMDYNEDRHVTLFDRHSKSNDDNSLVASIDSSVNGFNEASIYLNTLGKLKSK